MFGAIGRWLKSLSYLLTGRIDSKRRGVDTNVHTVRAKYDAVVQEKSNRTQQYMQAVAGLMAQGKKKLEKLADLTREVERLERLKAGALAKARQHVQSVPGQSKEAVQQDPEYQKCLSAYNDFSATLEEKQARIAELEQDVEECDRNVADHKLQLQQLKREIEQIKVEAHEAVADIVTASQEKEIADALAGIAEDGSTGELTRLRQLRQEVKAEAQISKELAGTGGKAQEAEFLEYARASVANDEFDALIGLAEAEDEAPAAEAEKETEGKSPLPE